MVSYFHHHNESILVKRRNILHFFKDNIRLRLHLAIEIMETLADSVFEAEYAGSKWLFPVPVKNIYAICYV